MADEQKPAGKPPGESIEERIAYLRSRGVKVNESGKNVAIVGTSSTPDTDPQPDAPKPDEPGQSMDPDEDYRRPGDERPKTPQV